MAIQIISGATNDIATVDPTSKALRSTLYDSNGAEVTKLRNTAYNPATDRFLAIGGVNDNVYRMLRTDRFGNVGTSKFTPQLAYPLFTAALPPDWLASNATMTMTHSLTSGTLINASAIGTLNTSSALISFRAVNKIQKGPLFCRHRLRLVKGGTNGVGDWGLAGQSSGLGQAVPTNGVVFLYGIDGTLKPTVYMNSTVVAQGTDFASSIDSTKYYTWDIIFDDDEIRFICQDSTTQAIVSQQSLTINALDPRFALSPYWFQFARSYVGGTANVGSATQLYVADSSVQTIDIDAFKPWSVSSVNLGYGAVNNPTIVRTQLTNWANSNVPATASLSNTAAGYTTLGGQFLFNAPLGAETDYALFAFSVPTGLNLNVTSIYIDTLNTGVAVATTPTSLSWFIGEAAAVTLASNSFRLALGNQSFIVGAAAGAQAQPISRSFESPFMVTSGRIFHIGLKVFAGTATASQVIRGTVSVNGYFD